MRALTPGERRGALVVVLLLALGATRDLVVSRFAPGAPPPGAAGPAAEPPGRVRASPPPPAFATGSAAALDSGTRSGRVDLNRADAAALDALPGIGPVLAGRILEHRRRVGAFRSVDELRAVRGVGPRLVERLRPLVLAGPDPAAAGSSPGRPGPARAVQSARPGRGGAADSAQVRPRADR